MPSVVNRTLNWFGLPAAVNGREGNHLMATADVSVVGISQKAQIKIDVFR